MKVVADASVGLKLVLLEHGRRQAVALFAENDAIAPGILRYETANGLLKDVRKRPRSHEALRHEQDVILSAYDALHATEPLFEAALKIALTLDHLIYDCLYLALADQQGLRLVTADRKFWDKATTAGWTNIDPLAPWP